MPPNVCNILCKNTKGSNSLSRILGGIFFIFFTFLILRNKTLSSFSTQKEVKVNKVNSSNFRVYDLSTAPKSSSLFCTLITNKNYSGLHSVLSKDLKEVFLRPDFVESFNASSIKRCKEVVLTKYLSNTFAQTDLKIEFENGSEEIFKTALKKEGLDWRLYGTEEN